MRVLIVLDHPYTLASAEDVPHRRSFTAAVAAAAIRGAEAAGHEVDLIDLAADGFAPAMTAADLAAWRTARVVDPRVADYQRRLLAADHLVFAFPVWWEAMPAATKGFLDRVLTKGVLFEELSGAKGNPFRNLMTRLGAVTVLSVMTTPDKAYRWWFRDPMTKILFRGTFGKIGVKNLTWVNYDRVADKTPEQRRRMLLDTETRFAKLAPARAVADKTRAGADNTRA
ncbi:NAD(P)H-dependent oxidoreductase [Catenulispora sp. NL8]|uniref:NAD(P)H-dependent oxidoreductase n=1 Tax=Catenulispora pinistramenti TaxID=2705254 RepID=A0ABS5L3T2_9ACTN|nr:NAD(P)H-dependent oxidoreductase [Catenulispora pinistramenti]MBS2552976.1 NAD(P)H-dependent oxidoreductase [Catenulispora pinistramenti]